MTLVLCGLIQGIDREVVLAPDWEPIRFLCELEPFHPEIDRLVSQGSFRKRQPPEIRGSGYVVDCLEAALWAFHDANGFPDAVLRAVNLGDDADTTGAVCGQLAGACWGQSGIPQAWLTDLCTEGHDRVGTDGPLGGDHVIGSLVKLAILKSIPPAT